MIYKSSICDRETYIFNTSSRARLLPLTKTDPDIPGVSTLIGSMLPLEHYKAIVFWAAIIEGLIGGLVAGKITDSKMASGLIHSVLLILITYTFYNLLL